MHTIFFGLKRAFQSTLRVTRPLLARFGLTAARFDMLYVIQGRSTGAIRQSVLRRVLGVTAPTVSRMLRSLEELGLVRRTLRRADRRQRSVSLTSRGVLAIRRAVKWAMASGAAQLAVDSALSTNPHGPVGPISLDVMDDADALLRRMRRTFGDHATLEYPWHPDD